MSASHVVLETDPAAQDMCNAHTSAHPCAFPCHAVLSSPQSSLVLPVTLTTGEAGALLKDGHTGFQAGVLPKLALLGPPLGCYTSSFQALFHGTRAGCQTTFTKDTWAIASRKLFQSSEDQMQASTEPDFPNFLHALSLLISSNFEPGPNCINHSQIREDNDYTYMTALNKQVTSRPKYLAIEETLRAHTGMAFLVLSGNHRGAPWAQLCVPGPFGLELSHFP